MCTKEQSTKVHKNNFVGNAAIFDWTLHAMHCGSVVFCFFVFFPMIITYNTWSNDIYEK